MSLIRPLETRFDARFYDGAAPVRHYASVELGDAALTVTVEGGSQFTWAYSDFRVTADGSYGEPVRLEHTTGGALSLDSRDFTEALRQHGVKLDRLPFDPRSWQTVFFAGMAIAVLGSAMYFWGLRWMSEEVAMFMPQPVEDRLGRSVVRLLAPPESRCTDAVAAKPVQAIFDRLVAASGSKQKFTLIFSDTSIVNAFAAPGGYVVVFRGLLEDTETPEEFAGVLAHEIQHVLLRHAARAVAREFSGRAMLSLMSVDSSGTPAAIQAGAQLANLSYQRSDEAAADLAGLALLKAANIRPDGLPLFLNRLQDGSSSGSALKYLSTHPAMDERVAVLRDAARASASTAPPIMSPEEWRRVRNVCSSR